jgi:hypothetical protein
MGFESKFLPPEPFPFPLTECTTVWCLDRARLTPATHAAELKLTGPVRGLKAHARGGTEISGMAASARLARDNRR